MPAKRLGVAAHFKGELRSRAFDIWSDQLFGDIDERFRATLDYNFDGARWDLWHDLYSKALHLHAETIER